MYWPTALLLTSARLVPLVHRWPRITNGPLPANGVEHTLTAHIGSMVAVLAQGELGVTHIGMKVES